MEIQDVLNRLDGVKANGTNKWQAHCPCIQNHAHGDKNPSLTVTLKDTKILMHCHTGCTIEEICGAIGIEPKELFTDAPTTRERTIEERRQSFMEWWGRDKGYQFIKAYSYCYGKYNDGLTKARYLEADGKKTFRWLKDDPAQPSGFKLTHDGCANRLYVAGNLDEEEIFVVEGEKDADNLHSLTGKTVVSAEDGAQKKSDGSKWRPEYTDQLAGKTVVVMFDNDPVGRSFAKIEADAIATKAKGVRLIDIATAWKECPEKGDVSDMIKALGKQETLARLQGLIEQAPEWRITLNIPSGGEVFTVTQETPQGAPQEATKDKSILTLERAIDILNHIDDIYLEMTAFPQLSKTAKIRTHDSVILAADTGVGKSSLALNILHSLIDQYPALYINLEMDEGTILQRLVSIHTGMVLDKVEGYKKDDNTRKEVDAAMEQILSYKEIRLLTDAYNIQDIEAEIRTATKDREEPTIVFIDTGLLVTLSNGSMSRYERFTHISEELRRIARLNNIVMFILLQQSREGKKSTDPRNSSLKETGSWENDATKIIFLTEGEKKWEKKLTITKNRNGEKTEVNLIYDAFTQTYSENGGIIGSSQYQDDGFRPVKEGESLF